MDRHPAGLRRRPRARDVGMTQKGAGRVRRLEAVQERAVRIGVIALVAVAAVVLLITALYALDAGRHRDRVARRVQIAGRDVGGMDEAELTAAVTALEKEFNKAAVTIAVSGKGADIETTTEALGVSIDRQATIAAAMGVGRGGSIADRVGGWLAGFFNARKGRVQIDVQPGKAYAEIAAKDEGRTPAVEPSLKVEEGTIVAVPGTDGKGVDAADVIKALPDAAADGLPVELTVKRGTVEPRFTLEDAQRLVAQAEEEVDHSVAVAAGGTKATLSAAKLRSWLTTEGTDDGLVLALDHARVNEGLPELLPDAGKAPTETKFTIGGGGVNIVAGTPGTTCCSDAAADLIESALFGDDTDDDAVIDLPLKDVAPKRTVEEARALGIKELVGAFTTKHPAGQPRVTNIHRIADLIRGQVIEPGATFSVNNFVGPRTTEKGFVVDNVIEDGRFAQAVGGGISQFATTLFNAAFFAGLDLTEYQTHSIYISRYPYGREATLSYPKPDLRITNKTPHGILIWPSYTSTQITVELYSTKIYEVTQSNQTKEPRGQSCTTVRTERTIKNIETGEVKKDSVRATYRGAEGLNCDQPLSASTTTTRPGQTTTTAPSSATTTTAPPSTTSPPTSAP